QERARQLLPVGSKALRGTAALDRRITTRAAWAHVHRADELEASWEERVPSDARYRDHPILEWLPQRLEDRARELRQLVEKEHAMMREGDLARTGGRPTTDDGGRGCAVVRRPEGRHREQGR